MQRYVQNLGLSPRWWWGSVAAVVLVALIFLSAGSTAAALICLVCAAAIAWMALSAGDYPAADAAGPHGQAGPQRADDRAAGGRDQRAPETPGADA